MVILSQGPPSLLLQRQKHGPLDRMGMEKAKNLGDSPKILRSARNLLVELEPLCSALGGWIDLGSE